jgi:hypothetical protein
MLTSSTAAADKDILHLPGKREYCIIIRIPDISG